jgi:hypothetical protein
LWYWFRDHFVVPVSIFSDAPATVTECYRAHVLCLTRSLGDGFGFLDCFDFAPIMRGRLSAAVAAICERQQEMIRLPVFGVAASAAHRHSEKA